MLYNYIKKYKQMLIIYLKLNIIAGYLIIILYTMSFWFLFECMYNVLINIYIYIYLIHNTNNSLYLYTVWWRVDQVTT